MLVEFEDLCRREGLRYSLAGGTLLGAVRHKGFIPWDDDIDVSMPRPDFDRLVTLARSGALPKNRSLEPYSGDWGHPVFLKYINHDIAVDAHYENGEGFLWMDVTPVEGLPADEEELTRIYKRAGRLQRILMFCKADPGEGKTQLKRAFKRLFVPAANAVGVFEHSLTKLDDLGRGYAFGSPLGSDAQYGVYTERASDTPTPAGKKQFDSSSKDSSLAQFPAGMIISRAFMETICSCHPRTSA